jgi:signal transduction histidine kinase
VFVSLKLDNDALELRISDNGIGLNGAAQNGFGNGLRNMKKRAESMHAELTLESPGQGTLAFLRIPRNGTLNTH